MARGSFDPAEYGITETKDEFVETMWDYFNTTYRGNWTVDELLLHPREAARFCDNVRHDFGYYDVPDDIILRVILARRKHPTG